MKKAPKLKHENLRLASLNSLRVLDSEPEAQFDAITKLASSLAGCPISLISLVDDDRQWFKSNYGIDEFETPREISFCGHAIESDEVFIVEDARDDERFHDNPLCLSSPHVIFYAGIPLKLSDGFNIGTLCVIDHKPKKLNATQIEQLEILAHQVVNLLELRLMRIQSSEILKAIKVGSFIIDVTTGEKTHSDSLFDVFPKLNRIKKPLIHTLVHSEDVQRLKQCREEAIKNGEDYKVEYRTLTEKKDEYRWVGETGKAIKNKAGKVVTLNGICQDITALKLKEVELNNSNTLLKLALDGGDTGTWDWFIDEDRVVYDRGWAALFGIDFNKMKMDFSTWQERVHPDDLGMCFKAINDYLEGKSEKYEVIHRMKHSSGKWVYTRGKAKISARDKNGKPIRLTGTQVDMTEVIENELKLEEMYETLQRTERNAKIGSWTIDLNTGEPWLSDESYRIYGLEIGSDFETEKGITFYHPDDQPRIIKYVNDAIEKQIPYSDEFRFITAKGENIWVRASGQYFEDKAKGIKRLEGSFQDITIQKQAEMAKDEFLSVISHEIRTPLTSIIGLSEVMAEKKYDDETIDCVQSINIAGHTVLTLINDVLDFSKLKNGRVSILTTDGDLEDFLEETIKLLEIIARNKGISLELDTDIKNSNVKCDFVKLRQVLINLLSNAIKFTDQGGVQLLVREKSAGEFYFEVSDSGCGMTEEFLPKIFNVFEQDHNSKKVHAGTGLGMNISQRLIFLMESEIHVESKLGVGSKFSFTIHLDHSFEARSEKNKVSPLSFDGLFKGLILAFADDNHMNKVVVEKMLSHTGIKFLKFSNGKEISDFILEGNKVDFILMDIQMPVMNGYDATQRIRAYEKSRNSIEVPILAFSAFSFQKDIDLALEAGCTDHISKPIKKSVLIEKLNSTLELKKAS